MTRAQEGDIVRVRCEGRLLDGRQFEMAPDGAPIEIIIGHGDLLPEVEQAVVGMVPGESKTVIVPKGKGYGPRRDDLIQTIDRNDFPKGIDPKVGQKLRLPAEGYDVLNATIVKVTDSEITVDINHPLADQDLLFQITLVEIVTL